MKKALLFLLLTQAQVTYAQRAVLYPIAIGSNAFDVTTTRTNLKLGARELNPIMMLPAKNVYSHHAVAMGFNIFAVESSMRLKAKGSKHWYIPILVHTGLHVSAGFLNKAARQ